MVLNLQLLLNAIPRTAPGHSTVSCVRNFEFRKLSLKVWVCVFEFKMVWKNGDWKNVLFAYAFDNLISPLDWHYSHCGCGRYNHSF